jgi:N-acetylneuraminate synthase
MNPYIEILRRKIGLDYPPLVIAEIELIMKVLEVAKEMVDAAQKSRR